MPINLTNSTSNIKKNLQARKEKILQDIKYYEKRIEDFHATESSSSNIYFENSSDSEDDFPISIDNDPSISQLKITQSQLRTCLQATKELTNLQVLQSEFTLMVEDPVIEGETPVFEPGSWRQVIADCRIDLVPFCMQFYVHQANRTFAPKSYRCLKVLVAKVAQEVELTRSILPGVKKPSDAIEVIRSYGAAYRSRRTTLFKLAEDYGNHLQMEPRDEGGYLLKCANLLEVSWCLENRWSPLAPFHHSLKFDLEYMDESYLKIISKAHKQLSDPLLETDQRTLLLGTIFGTCLEAQRVNYEANTSMESEKSIGISEKRSTKNNDDIEPLSKKKRDKVTGSNENERDKRTDDEIMAPPKSLPKKTKPKGKENADQNRKSLKRSSADEIVGHNKKTKTDMDIRRIVDKLDEARKLDANVDENEANLAQNEANLAQSEANLAQNELNTIDDAANVKAKTKTSSNQKNSNKEQVKNVEKTKDVKKIKTGNHPNKITEQKSDKNQVTEKNGNKQENANSKELQEKIKNKTELQKVTSNDKNVASAKNDPKSKPQKAVGKDKMIASSKNVPKTKNFEAAKDTNSDNNVASLKTDPKINENNTKKNNNVKNMAKNTPSNTDQPKTGKTNDKNEKADNQKVVPKELISKKVVDNSKNVKRNQINDKLADPIKKSSNTANKVKIISNVLLASTESNILPKTTKPGVANAKNSKDNENNAEKGPNDHKFDKNNTRKPQSQVNSNKLSNVASNKPKTSQKQITTGVKTTESNAKQKEVTEKIHKMKNVATKEHISDRTDSNNVANNKKLVTNTAGNTNTKFAIKNLSHKNHNAQKKMPKSGSNIFVKSGNTKQNGVPAKTSKIPQKRLTPLSEKSSKKNPLRISPRKIALTFKCASDTNLKQKIQLKHGTNIPRLRGKPEQNSK